ncbi:minor capsid protein [Olivibacter sp. 47]|uniref:minor capsid protein n=1 Tax=Olivibacter sp. 47 TaxID=3056486 RepID=UPI0025A3CC31|nr:minor capsid protein [Olivibacter sp. 47]MDM8176856.1 minor capsid protein [Olivibacter sp. 47]
MSLKVWENKGMPKGGIDPEVVSEYANRLWTGVTEGYGLDIPKVDFDLPDFETLLKLKENVWQFSAAKNYQQLTAISRELVDSNNRIRSFNDFRDAAVRINIDHVRHLETEYNTAIAGGQMSSLWTQIEAESNVLPYLEFVAVIDGRTSDQCKELNGVILHWTHPFWDKWYPPNHYGCRSTVRRHANATPTNDSDIIYPSVEPGIFGVNLGKQKLAFPPDHPYYDGVPKKVLDNAVFHLPEQEQYSVTKVGKGQIRLHIVAERDNKSDMKALMQIATELAEKGGKLDVLPEIHAKEAELRNKLLPDTKGNKNPDLRIDGKYWEHERPTLPVTWDKVENRIRAGNKQANRVLIQLDEYFGNLEGMARSRFKALKDLKEITFRTVDGKYLNYKRP